jgi:hypothetical protein
MWYLITVAWDVLQRTAKMSLSSVINGENERLFVGRRKRTGVDAEEGTKRVAARCPLTAGLRAQCIDICLKPRCSSDSINIAKH